MEKSARRPYLHGARHEPPEPREAAAGNRGTRLRENLGKSWFTILDFKRATELFADKEFDGEPVHPRDRAWSPNHGDSAFTVPLFDKSMKRAIPGSDWR